MNLGLYYQQDGAAIEKLHGKIAGAPSADYVKRLEEKTPRPH
jgi:hypothetical protein